MVVDEPATEAHLAKVLDRTPREVADALRELADEYTVQGRGFELRLVMRRLAFLHPGGVLRRRRALRAGRPAGPADTGRTGDPGGRRVPPAGEPLAGLGGPQVNCDGVMRTLLQRGLVAEAGTEPETGAILYRTTNYFLERMGLRGLDELPELAPFLPEADAIEAETQEGVPSFDPDAPDTDEDDKTTEL